MSPRISAFSSKIEEAMVKVVVGAARRNNHVAKFVPRKGDKVGSIVIKLGGV